MEHPPLPSPPLPLHPSPFLPSYPLPSPLPPSLDLTFSAFSFIPITLPFSFLLFLLMYLSCFFSPPPLTPPDAHTHTHFEPCSPQSPLSSTLLSGRWVAYRPYVVPGTGRSLVDVAWQPGKRSFSPGPHAANTLEHLNALTLLLPVALS